MSTEKNPFSNTAVIVLGDLGFNYYGPGSRDDELKRQANDLDIFIYAVRGNHEMRPQDIPDMKLIYDVNVRGTVYQEEKYPNIRYFRDYGVYDLNGICRTAVIGGAYSVDKEYRIMRGWSWFPNEQLSIEEQEDCLTMLSLQKFDLVLSHTCPISWEPRDLFLSSIDQSKVDKTTEEFLEKVKNNIEYKYWYFGHFHADRLQGENGYMLFNDFISLEELMGKYN